MKTLTQNINYAIVLRVIGWLLMIEAGFMVLPLLVGIYYGERPTMYSFLWSVVITLGVGAGMAFGLRPSSMSMRKREGLMLTATVWLFFSVFGMLPFLFAGTLPCVTDAFFETMAGFTTTGSSVIADPDALPHSILFWRSLTQWIGGMGIILFTLAVLPMLNYKGGITLFNAEVTGLTHERMRPRVSQTAKDLWLMYIGFTVVMTLLLGFTELGWFNAVCHTFSTVSTGGFSTKTAGLGFWHNYYVDVVIMVFMFLCGTNFALMYRAAAGDLKALRRSDTFRWYVGAIIVIFLLVLGRMVVAGFCDNWADRLIYSSFDTISAITSTGYTTFDYETSGEFICFVLMVAMFFGGMAGSTSGGAKIDRMIVVLKNTKNEFYRILHSNSIRTVRIEGRSLPPEVVSKAIAFLAIYVLVMVSVALVLSMMGMQLFDSLFTSMSAISNVGLGYGVTGPEGSFMVLPDAAKWLLAFEMMVGRLELFTVLVLFTKHYWFKE